MRECAAPARDADGRGAADEAAGDRGGTAGRAERQRGQHAAAGQGPEPRQGRTRVRQGASP